MDWCISLLALAGFRAVPRLARQMIRLSGLREEDSPIEFVGLRPGEKLNMDFEGIHRTLREVVPAYRSGGDAAAHDDDVAAAVAR